MPSFFKKRLPLIALLAISLWMVFPVQRNAEAELLRLHLQGHGTLLSGSGSDYFKDEALQLGGGAELGLKLLFILVTADVHHFGKQHGENIYWNQLMAGLEFGIPIGFDSIEFLLRAQVGYVSGTFDDPHPENNSYKSGGVSARAGGTVQFRIVPFTYVGANALFGAHFFGSDRGGGGAHVQTNLFLRFQLGTGGDGD